MCLKGMVCLNQLKMIENEYLKVKEIAQITNQSTRNVRRILSKLKDEKNNELLLKKDKDNIWAIHHLLLPKFSPKRIKKNKYYALSFDPCSNYEVNDIEKIMQFVFDKLGLENAEINYVIEQKKENGKNHLHCFVKCENKRKLLQTIRLGFAQINYKQTPIYDLQGWKEYITKQNNTIKKLN
jgi:transcriptional antiterminator